MANRIQLDPEIDVHLCGKKLQIVPRPTTADGPVWSPECAAFIEHVLGLAKDGDFVCLIRRDCNEDSCPTEFILETMPTSDDKVLPH
jgi:hypothetical protein